MSKNTLLIRNIVFAVIILFIGTNLSPIMVGDTMENTSLFIGCESVRSTSNIFKGSLSGYVNDTSMNPIKGVLIRAYFHETYAEDYTDDSGYYHVTNIPICFCLKNTTATKAGYKTEWVLLAIDEDTTYDFVLKCTEENNGSLTGYVNDSYSNPIEYALVSITCDGFHMYNTTDSNGFYYIGDVPIVDCYWNVSASKKGYNPSWIDMSIDINSTYDFILKNNKSYILD